MYFAVHCASCFRRVYTCMPTEFLASIAGLDIEMGLPLQNESINSIQAGMR